MRSEVERKVAWASLCAAAAATLAHALWTGALLGDAGLPFGAGLGALACVPLGFVPSALRGRPLKAVDTLGPWLLALDPTFARWASAGPETGVFACLLAFGLLQLGRESGPAPAPSRSLASALPFGLLCVLRPEGPLHAVAALAVRLLWLRSARAARNPQDAPLAPLSSALTRELGWTLLCALPLAAWLLFAGGARVPFPPAPSSLDSALASVTAPGTLGVWFRSRLALHSALWLVPLALFVGETRRAAVLGLAMTGAMVLFLGTPGGLGPAAERFVAHALPAVSLLLALVPVAIAELIGLLFFAQGVAAAARAGGGARASSSGDAGQPLEPAQAAGLLLLGLRGVRAQALALRVSAAVLLLFAALAAGAQLASPRPRAPATESTGR